jgi:O-antigen ligase
MFAFSPAAFGAVDAWSEMIVTALAATLAVVIALRPFVDAGFRIHFTWLYVPLGLFVALVAFESVPVPLGLAKLLSPASVTMRTELLGDTVPGEMALSVNPHSTIKHLRLVLAGSVVFVAVANVVRRTTLVKELLLLIFAIGCAQALLAIAQIATGAADFYWFLPTGGNSVITSGSFVNYSHFCQFMNLSIGAGIAYLLVLLHEQKRHSAHRSFHRRALALVNWEKQGWILCGIILSAITVFTSMSRNGAISLLVAGAVVGTALYRRGSLTWQGWLLGLLPMGVLAGLLIFGFDVVYDRLATLRDAVAYDGRWEMNAATLRAWLAFPVWGTGLGTHEFVFPIFDTAVTPVVAEHADNEYAQLLEETGAMGAALVAAFLIGIATIAVRLALNGRTPASTASFGIAFGLIAVAVHSFTDFGQRVPANFLLSAAFCGLLVAIARIEARDRKTRHGHMFQPETDPAIRRRFAAACALLGILMVSAWSLNGAYAAFLGERWWAGALTMEESIQKSPELADDQDYVDLLTAANAANQSDPKNAKYGYWLAAYRWQSMSRTVDPDTGQVLLKAELLPAAAQIADDLTQVRRICPTYGPPYALEGQIRLFVLNDQSGAELIRKGLRLAPYDAATCLVAGELAARDGKLDDAERLLGRAIQLRPAYYRDAASVLLDIARPDLARKLAADDYWQLAELASLCTERPEFASLSDGIKADAASSLRRHADGPDVQPYELASLALLDQQKGDHESSIALYRRALAQEYNQVDWRLNLARVLAATGQIDDAIHEVRICLRLRPHYLPARALLDDLLTRKPIR